jgi:hypothetical protein
MVPLPTDEDLPAEIVAGVRAQTFEGQQALASWLFNRFSLTRVNKDHLSQCLADLIEQLRAGLVPDHPVGLFRTMLFACRCDDRKRKKARMKAAQAAHAKLRAFLRSPQPDPAAEVMERELREKVFVAAICQSREVVAAVIWGRINGCKFDDMSKCLEEHFHEPWPASRARRTFFTATSRLRQRFCDA